MPGMVAMWSHHPAAVPGSVIPRSIEPGCYVDEAREAGDY